MNFFVERGKESNPTATGDPLFQKGESHLTTFPRTRLFLLLTLRPLKKIRRQRARSLTLLLFQSAGKQGHRSCLRRHHWVQQRQQYQCHGQNHGGGDVPE